MSMRAMLLALELVLALVAVAACSAGPSAPAAGQAGSTPIPSPTSPFGSAAVATASTAAAPSPTPTVMSTRQAAARYLALVGPPNAAIDQVVRYVPEGSDPSAITDLPAAEQALHRLADAIDVEVRGFEAYGWPRSVRTEIGELAEVRGVELVYLRAASQASTRDELVANWNSASDEDAKYPGAAKTVRARLGLRQL